MKNTQRFCLLTTMLVFVALTVVPAFADDDDQGKGTVMVFQAAGAPGDNGVLVEGATFPPGNRTSAVIKRTKTCLKYRVRTTGLPQGAYTNWWAVINKPENCAITGACNPGDLFNPATESGVFLATGSVVGQDGVGRFRAKVCKNDDLGFPGDWMTGDLARCRGGELCDQDQVIGPQHLFGELQNPKGAAVLVIVKYHGLPSDDPAALYDQTHTLLGSCTDAANALPNGQCFDPQLAAFQAPVHDD